MRDFRGDTIYFVVVDRFHDGNPANDQGKDRRDFDPTRTDITIDASLAKYGRRTFAVSEEQIRHPPELTVEDIEPEQVRLSLRPIDGAPTPNGTP